MKRLILIAMIGLSGCYNTGLVPRFDTGSSTSGGDSTHPVPSAPSAPHITPSLTISSASASIANQVSSVAYDINYTDADQITLSAADIILHTVGGATCAVAVSNINLSLSRVTLTNCTGDGSVGFNVAAGSASNSSGTSAPASSTSASFYVDNTGIGSASVSPATGTYSSVPSAITLNFPEMVDSSSVSASGFSLSGSCAGVSIASVTVSGAVVTVNMNGVNSCALGEDVILTVHMNQFSDSVGNAGSGSSVQTYTINNIGPTSASFSPVAGTAINSSFSNVTVTFGSSVDPSTVSAADFSVGGTCSGSGIASVSATASAADVVLSGLASCAHGQSVIVNANLAGMQDSMANSGVGSVSASYSFDNQAPSSSFSLAGGEVNAIPASVDVSFSADTNMATVTAGHFSLGGTCSGASIASVVKAANVATVNIAGGNTCAHGQSLILTVDMSGISDTPGNAASGSNSVTWSVDNQGPTSGVFSIASGATSLIPSSITLTLPHDTNMNSVTSSAFTVSGTCGASLASILKSGNVVTLNFSGTSSCMQSQTMNVSANFSGFTDAVGNSGSGSQAVNLTLDTSGPSGVLSLSSGSFNPIPTSLTLTLPANMNMSTVTSAVVAVTGTCGATLGSLTQVGVVATINLAGTGACTDGQTVVVTVNQTLMSNLLGNAGIGSLGVTLTLDSVGPIVTLAAPSGRYNPLNTSVTATFSADTDMNSVSASDFIVTGTCLGVSVGTISKVGQVATVNLLGTASCLNAQTLIVTTNPIGFSDSTGNLGLNIPQILTYTYDNVAPTALMLPLGIPVAIMPSSIVITFDLDTDMSTVTLASFSVSGTCGATKNSISKLANVVTLNLSGTGSCGFLKTVIVSTILTGVKDQAGNSGVGSQVQTFTQL